MRNYWLVGLSVIAFSFVAVESVNYKMVTLFVYNFARNIQWPENSGTSEFKIGVWGNSPFYDEASGFFSTKKINEQSIVVQQVSNMQDINNYRMVFVAPEKLNEIKRLAAVSAGSSVLLVTVHDNFMNGIGINLFTDNQDHKMKFQLNEAVMKNKNIKVSKTLVDLAYHH